RHMALIPSLLRGRGRHLDILAASSCRAFGTATTGGEHMFKTEACNPSTCVSLPLNTGMPTMLTLVFTSAHATPPVMYRSVRLAARRLSGSAMRSHSFLKAVGFIRGL